MNEGSVAVLFALIVLSPSFNLKTHVSMPLLCNESQRRAAYNLHLFGLIGKVSEIGCLKLLV